MMVRTLPAQPADVSPWTLVRNRARDYMALTKARVVAMVLITASVGFYLASPGPLNWLLLCHTLIGVALLPTTLHLAGEVYFATAFVLGVAMIVSGSMLAKSYSRLAARRLLFVSLIYLPALLAGVGCGDGK